ncbi:helicase-related protein [Leuconostocaceae bacterium ESL0958]|nr:helicase-related protein [Leuconostocaceae bacterium ESL0958]
MKKEDFYGRLVLLPKDEPVAVGLSVRPAFIGQRCQRCWGRHVAKLPAGSHYCLDCLLLGRVSSQDVLVTAPEPNAFPPFAGATWPQTLTSAQLTVSKALCQAYQRGQGYLVWAVTGAGKTEMLFPLLNQVLLAGGRIGLFAPRVDVILELAPRLQAVFDLPIQVLHGRTSRPYHYGQVVLATTHQALRFEAAFDLVIVDEVDAFPYRRSAMLQRAVARAKKPRGVLVLLTATPGRAERRAIRLGKLGYSQLPARYHGGLLAQIQVVYGCDWRKRCPRQIRKLLRHWQPQQGPLLIFVPRVADLVLVADQVAKETAAPGATVHASDPKRLEKVQALRTGQLAYLISTTILERGVTIPRVTVCIMGADEPTYNAAALVQMAGRVGRSAQAKSGLVLAFAAGPSRSLRFARRQIAAMNAAAQALAED